MAASAFQVIVIFLESFSLLLRTSSVFLLMTLYNLYCIVFDLYVAYFTMGFLAYLFVLVYNSPYLIALIRFAIRPDSVHRRRLLYNVCCTMYIIQISADMWVAINAKPDTAEICEAIVKLNPEIVPTLTENFKHMSEEEANIWGITACLLKFHLQRGFSQFFFPNLHAVIYLATLSKHWSDLKNEKVKAEKVRIR